MVIIVARVGAPAYAYVFKGMCMHPLMETVIEKIVRLKKERNAIILAHNYTNPEIQDIAEFTGDSLGLSSVKLLGAEQTEEFGTVLHVGGADLMDGTPIFDIKPYIPYGDSHPDAIGGFTDTAGDFLLDVDFPESLLIRLPVDKRSAVMGVLSHDPRPSYQRKPGRIYGISFAGVDIRFSVDGSKLTVIDVI